MWIEKPPGAPYTAPPHTWSVMLDAVEETQLMIGVGSVMLEGGSASAALAKASAVQATTANTDFLTQCIVILLTLQGRPSIGGMEDDLAAEPGTIGRSEGPTLELQ